MEFDKFWLSEKPKDVMEFNRIRDLFENQMRTLLEDRSAHFKINIAVDNVWKNFQKNSVQFWLVNMILTFRVRWVVEFLTWGIKISLILSIKFMEIKELLWIDIAPGTLKFEFKKWTTFINDMFF